MNALTFEETNLLCIYNPGTRQGAIEALTEMRGHLQADETELLALTGRRAAPFSYPKEGRIEPHANQSRTICADGRPGGTAAHRQLAGVGGLSHHRRPPLQISVP